MSGFSPAERTEVDDQYRHLAKGLHELGAGWSARLRAILQRAEQAPSDATLARVLVAAEIVRGIAADGRSPLTIRGLALPTSLSVALRDAETLGRDLGKHVHSSKRGLLRVFTRPPQRLTREAREALMRCRMIGVQAERRAAPREKSVQTR